MATLHESKETTPTGRIQTIPAKAHAHRPTFSVHRAGSQRKEALHHRSRYRLAEDFVQGHLDVEGDLVAAVRHFRLSTAQTLAGRMLSLFAHYGYHPVENWAQSRRRCRNNIEFHYDHPNEFYEQFLDSQLVYSCAYFQSSTTTLDDAQTAKLDHISRKLRLQPDETFLDIGCGWGALVRHAARNYGVRATGCTLSRHQFSYAEATCRSDGFGNQVRFLYTDYRDLDGTFDKIASVGMYEHVGRHRISGYFQKVASLLTPAGMFLNHAISRPQGVHDNEEALFRKRFVFPGGELVHLADTIHAAEDAGFEILDVENLRPHYALTCRAWIERLKQHATECQQIVGPAVYRIWLLFLAASADSFERGETDIYQVLMAKRSRQEGRYLTRRHIYQH